MDRKEQIEQLELMKEEQRAGVPEAQETINEAISDKHLNYLKSVLIAQLLLEANDELKGSKAFRQNIKYQVGKTNKLLEEVYQDGFNTIYHNNPEMCLNVLNKIDSLIHKIKTASIDELVMIDALVDKYFENKDEINETQTAEFTKIE